MNPDALSYQKIVRENIDQAIETQSRIFPNENGALNLIASVDPEAIELIYGKNNRKTLEFYLCADEQGVVVGLTGIYSYYEYPEDAWCGWYGVVPEKRGHGYGKAILLWTMSKAKEMGYENFRLYTDMEDNAVAAQLYTKLGMICEEYTAENLGGEKMVIFSKNLLGQPTKKFGNKKLFLKEQLERQARAKKLFQK